MHHELNRNHPFCRIPATKNTATLAKSPEVFPQPNRLANIVRLAHELVPAGADQDDVLACGGHVILARVPLC